jgi:nucleoside-diphosphate-sugar epimerase
VSVVLLTGAGGFLGKSIAASLLAAGVARLRLQYRNSKPPLLDTPAGGGREVEAMAANLLDRTKLGSLLEGVECIVHAAAGLRGATADMFLNTVVSTKYLLDAAVAAGVRRIVLVSSFAVYQSGALARGALLTENCPLEPPAAPKSGYGFVKTRQEQLYGEYAERHGFESVVLRPGVVYGPGGTAISPRVGLSAFGRFFSLGGSATLPLTYVENCADAVALAALHAKSGSAINVVDDDLPRCRDYLRRYCKEVRRLPVVPVPYSVLLLGSRILQSYSRRSLGQLPAMLTPYMVRSMFRPLRYSNAALKSIGWTQRIPTAEGLRLTMSALAVGSSSAGWDAATQSGRPGTGPRTRLA